MRRDANKDCDACWDARYCQCECITCLTARKVIENKTISVSLLWLDLTIDEVRALIRQLEHEFINREENELAYLVLQRMIRFVRDHDELVK